MKGKPPAAGRVRWLALPGTIWLLLLYVVPGISVISLSLQQGSVERGYRFTFAWQVYATAWERYDAVFARSIVYAACATILCLLIAYPLAYTIAFFGGRMRSMLLFFVVMPFFISVVIRTLSWKFFLADEGLFLTMLRQLGAPEEFRILNTPGAVVAGLVYNYLPFMTFPIFVALDRMDQRLFDASADLYAGPLTTFRRVILPLSKPGLISGALLTFVPAAGDFINAELLGGAGQKMIGSAIQRQFLVVNDYPIAAALSLLLLVGLILLVLVGGRATRAEELVV